MQLLGQPVRHNAFGTGVITGLSGNIITIDFAQGEKRFQYPDAFSRFLTLKDAGKQNEIRAGYERRLRAERAERQKELERQVRDDFWGAYCREGMIRAHDRYKLYLPSGSMLPYWNYFEQEEFVPRWGKVVFKYFSSRVMQRILLDMCGVMDGTDQGETAAEFCDYFCAINRLSAEQAQTKATADE